VTGKARKKPRQAAKAAPRPAIPRFTVPGRRTELTRATADEIAQHVMNFSTLRDACEMAGVMSDTGAHWLVKGRAIVNGSPGDVPAETQPLYTHFFHAVENARAKRRHLLKGLMRRAAVGTEKKPGDWRAAQALGAVADPDAFVPQVRVYIASEIDSMLERVRVRFADQPEVYAAVLEAVAAGDVEPEDGGNDGEPH
jgi:hypothetical protein